LSRCRRRTSRSACLILALAISTVVSACGAAVQSVAVSPSDLPTASALVASPSAHASGDCAALKLQAMDESRRIGQLFILGIEGDAASVAEVATLNSYHLGSIWLVNNRTGGAPAVRRLADAIQALATPANTDGVGFFVGADQEGGQIQRISGPGFSTIPPATVQGTIAASVLRADATAWGRELVAAGVNLDLAPVMDVVPPGADGSNEPIGALQREFGHDPATVGDHGAAVVQGMSDAGVATTLKHFPGLGRVVGNTDTAAGVVDAVTSADDPYLSAFRSGIAAGAPMVMISLATYTKIDPNHQAVFSRAIIEDLLRNRLGFEGVVVSDDLGAAKSVASMPAGDRAVGFVAAGGDLIVVVGTTGAAGMAAALAARASSDAGFRALIDAAALRVLRAKAAYGLLSCGG
jgi:beta-N-acetylhexosaminidase